MAQVFTQENFQQEVLRSPTPVLVDFWAPWCGPCKMIAPIIEQLSKDYDGKGIKIGKLNVDEHPNIAAQYGVMSIPTLIIFKNGAPAEQAVGLQSKDRLVEKIEKVIG